MYLHISCITQIHYREGTSPDEVNYYPSMDYGPDTNRTFTLKELIIFTDYLYIPQTRFTRQCNITAGQFPCLIKGCFTEEEVTLETS